MSTSRAAIIDIGVSVLSLTVFFYVSLANISLPGLYYDEAMDVVPTMQIVLGQPVEAWAGVSISLGGRTFPVMIMSYLGTVCTYLMLPFFYFLGVSVFSLRLMTIVFGYAKGPYPPMPPKLPVEQIRFAGKYRAPNSEVMEGWLAQMMAGYKAAHLLSSFEAQLRLYQSKMSQAEADLQAMVFYQDQSS